MEKTKVLVVDNDPTLRTLIDHTFAREDYDSCSASDDKEALRAFFARHPDLVILETMMPRMDGWETCRRIREVSSAIRWLGRGGARAATESMLPQRPVISGCITRRLWLPRS
jgi:CheY-like chemotaxis protein